MNSIHHEVLHKFVVPRFEAQMPEIERMMKSELPFSITGTLHARPEDAEWTFVNAVSAHYIGVARGMSGDGPPIFSGIPRHVHDSEPEETEGGPMLVKPGFIDEMPEFSMFARHDKVPELTRHCWCTSLFVRAPERQLLIFVYNVDSHEKRLELFPVYARIRFTDAEGIRAAEKRGEMLHGAKQALAVLAKEPGKLMGCMSMHGQPLVKAATPYQSFATMFANWYGEGPAAIEY